MPRPRKITTTDKMGRKLAGALENCWWKWKPEDEGEEVDTIIVYSKEKLKIKLEPMAYYSYPSGEEAFQYRMLEGSKEHKDIFKMLGLNDSHEKKPVRKKRITKAEKLAQEAAKAVSGEKKKRGRKAAND